MAGKRIPLEVIQARGKKHLTKAEIEERQKREIKPIADEITAPDFLTGKQVKEFDKIAAQLKKLKIMGETDVDALGRYIVAKDFYVNAVKQMRKKDNMDDPYLFESWSKIQERYFKQCRACASDLGLTISSRCKLVVPIKEEEPQKVNKFAKFEKSRAGGYGG